MHFKLMDRLLDYGGWTYDPVSIGAVIEATADKLTTWGAPTPGIGEGKTVCLYRAFSNTLGRQPTYPNQTSGTCVGRGGARTVDLLQAMQGAWTAFASSEAAFAFARIEVGLLEHKQRPPSDGAVVAWVVEAMRKFGSVLRCDPGVPATDDDDLAQKWGNDRKEGVPAALEALAKRRIVKAWTPISGYTQARDAIASGYVVIFGTSRAQWGRSLPAQRDKQGFLTTRGSTGHCWIATGVVDDRQRPGILLDNKSWGDDWVAGPKGVLEDMPDGDYLCEADEFDKIVSKGEAYAVSDMEGFEPKPLDYLFY
ncbi:MAG: hypothetical protein ABFD92_21645 [Planctomycetaceae bacterium]